MSQLISQQSFSQRPLPMFQIAVAHQAILFPLYFFVPIWITLINLLCVVIVFITGEKLSQSKLLKWLKITVALAALFATYVTFKSISGKQAGVALIAVMYGLKILETHKLRDANILLALGFFVLSSGLLLTQKPWIMLYQIIPVIAILNALVATHSLDVNKKNNFSISRIFKEFSKYLLFALPIMLVLFLFFPRLDGPIWRMPGSSSGVSGVSDTMSPGEISSLQMSNKIAFRVKFESEINSSYINPANTYWRVMTMDKFDGLTWSRGQFLPLNITISEQQKAQAVEYTLTLEATKQKYLVTLDKPLVMPKRGQLFSDYSVKTNYKILDRTRYSGVSFIGQASTKDLHEKLSSFEKQRYLRLPTSGNSRMHQWAKTYRKLVDSDWAFIRYVLQEINQKEYFYTLTPPIMDRETQDSFWFTHKKGFCEHYAGALVFLARAANIPARVVVGYQGAEKNPLSDYWIVRHSNAHAWTEIWIEQQGWVRVDPTTAIAPHRVEQQIQSDYAYRDGLFDDFSFVTLDKPGWFKQLDYWVDGFNNQWNDWVLDYNREKQLKNFHNWGIGLIKPVTIIMIIFLGILLVTTLMSFSWRFPIKNKDLLANAFIKFQKRLDKNALVQLNNAQGPWALKAQLAQHGVIQFQNINQLIDEYIKVRYQTDNPSQEKVKKLIKKLNQQPIPKGISMPKETKRKL